MQRTVSEKERRIRASTGARERNQSLSGKMIGHGRTSRNRVFMYL